MKKIARLILVAALTFSMVFSASAVTKMYAPDGRTANVNDYDVWAWKNVGWYDYPVAIMYAPDGRTTVISKNAVQSWKNVGWYDYPVATVYAPDGRTAVISKNAVQSWKSVGWYDYPVVTVYAPDGRTAVIAKTALQSWKNVGWYESASAAANALGVDLLPSMSAERKRDVNIFLSNFSEVFYKHGSYYGSDAEEKIAFAYNHAMINMNDATYYSDGYMCISADNVDYILKRFFGYSIPRQTPAYSKYWSYRNGVFLCPAASGGTFADFSIVTKMTKRSDGTYEVKFNIYSDPNACCGDFITDKSLYSLSAYDASIRCDYRGYGTAILKDKVHNGRNSYELVSYNVSYNYMY